MWLKISHQVRKSLTAWCGVSCCSKILGCYITGTGRGGLAALHIKQKAGRPLSDWKAQVKWSTAAVSSTALPPDWFSWRHPPLRSSFPQPKSSLLSLKWIAVLQPHINIFSQYQIFSVTKTNAESLLQLQVQSAYGLLMDLTLEMWAKRFPICTQHNWHFGLINGGRTDTNGDITSISFAADSSYMVFFNYPALQCRLSTPITCMVVSLCRERC